MLCPACQGELTRLSLTGTLLRVTCSECQVHLLEAVETPIDLRDFLNILSQIRKERTHDNG